MKAILPPFLQPADSETSSPRGVRGRARTSRVAACATGTDAISMHRRDDTDIKRAFLIFVLFQILVWTIVARALAVSLPLDVVSDGISWGHEWQLGYYKHPPLPAWLTEIAFDTLGDVGPFLLSQLAIAATYLLVYALGREVSDVRQAVAGTMLLAGTIYFSTASPEFNNNVAQMPAWAAIALTFYKALNTKTYRWWLALGLACGVGILMKYSSALLIAVAFVYLIANRSARQVLLTPKPYLSMAVFAVTIAPHVYWLILHHIEPIRYAVNRGGNFTGIAQHIWILLNFVLAQLADQIVLILVAMITGFMGRQMLPKRTDFSDPNFQFLIALGLGPALLSVLLSMLTGLGLRAMWGAPMWNLTGLLIVFASRHRLERTSLRRLYVCTAVLFVLQPTAYAFETNIGPQLLGQPCRTLWPDRAMAVFFDNEWNMRVHQPLGIVAGDGWLAGLVAMRSSPRASVFIDGNFDYSSWITPERISREGALVIWQIDKKHQGLPAELATLPHLKTMGVHRFKWPRAQRMPDLEVGWGIIAPQDPVTVRAK